MVIWREYMKGTKINTTVIYGCAIIYNKAITRDRTFNHSCFPFSMSKDITGWELTRFLWYFYSFLPIKNSTLSYYRFNATYFFLSKLFLESFNFISAEFPSLLNNVMYTFASVPAPRMSPVCVEIVYLWAKRKNNVSKIGCTKAFFWTFSFIKKGSCKRKEIIWLASLVVALMDNRMTKTIPQQISQKSYLS